MIDAGTHRIRAHLSRREQREQRPCRMIGCTGGLGRGARIAVVALTPPAVGVLTALEPIDSLAHRRILPAEAGLSQRRQRRPRAVDIVGAPATEPRAIALLFGPQIGDRAGQRRFVLWTGDSG